ncbi:MAG: UDP-2,3-diacylglucosamine diphosphatase [Deltaproteobacteria bacterium]|nr:UDP-2,3-diacylglucosamine diphosphatase [Deltaproteobacteria bacterium]
MHDLKAIVADLHLDGSRSLDTALENLVDRLDHLHVHELFILGDMFDYLIGDKRYIQDHHYRALDRISAFRKNKKKNRVHLLEGNREFFVRDSFLLHRFFDSIGETATFRAGRKSFFLEHGDRIDPYDRRYRFWRFVSKNIISYAAMKAIPAKLGTRIVSNFEKRLKNLSPEGSIVDKLSLVSHARAMFFRNFDVVVTGHFHRFFVYSENGRKLVVMPAWRDTQSFALIGPRGDMALIGPGAGYSPRTRKGGKNEQKMQRGEQQGQV